MKRLRDENISGSQFKRPYGSSRGESYGQPQNTVGSGGGGGGGTGGQKLTTGDALQYLKEVKEMFQDQRGKYEQFLEVMKDFKAQRIDTEGVIAHVKELFKGHNNLIFGFNTFLPKGYEITLDDEEPPKKVVEFEEAINFVNKIKKRFQNDDQVYKSFLDILNMYRKEHKSISEVYDEVSQLFEEHPDLLDEFTRFMPVNSSATTTLHPQLNRSTLLRFEERSSDVPPPRQVRTDKQRWRRDKINTSLLEHDLSVGRPELDDDRVSKVHKDQKKRVKENHDKRSQDLDDREAEHDNNRNFNIQHHEKKKPSRKLEGFKANPSLASSDDKTALKSMYSQEFIFCEKVKDKLGNAYDYQAFLKCLHIFSTEIITRDELQSLVADLLGKYPDLMEGFNEFVDRCENIGGFLAGVMNKKSMWNDGRLPRSIKADDKEKAAKREMESAKEKPNKDYTLKSIQELDLSNCKISTPSYRLLPDDYPIPAASQRSELGAQVLNDHWVSVTSGSEDFSFKHMRRNQYEESLFRCEDDRFELDMLLESVSSTVKRAEDLLNNINNNSISSNGLMHIEEYFTPLNLRCIERIYGDHGLDVLDILHKNPVLALSVILTRLKQKQEEWTKCRTDFDKVWAEIYAKNHYKSLDHRSFYFKQQDSKNLSNKSLVVNIKEIKEELQKEADILLAVSAGNKRPLLPHLQYESPDSDIHEDLFKIIKFSCEEVLSTKEQLNKAMRLWTTFLEQMLGVSSHIQSDDDVDDIKAGQQTAEISAERGESPGSDADHVNPKQSKLVINGDESSLADITGCSKIGNDATMEGSLCASDTICREGSSPNLQPKEPTDVVVSDGLLLSDASLQIVAESRHVRSYIESSSGARATPSRPLNVAEDDQKPKPVIDIIQSSRAPNVLTANGTFTHGSKSNQYPEGRCKGEKEEGELSPIGDVEDNSFAYADAGTQAGHKEKSNVESHSFQDPDDDDSENASEAGDDMSGGDECSRDDHEEQEDVEHDPLDGKAESEGEAETHYLGCDTTTLPLSERGLFSVKPLAKYVSSVSRDADKKDFRVFYGNDNFYVLFRLHQTLYERLLTAKTISACSETKWKNSKDASSLDSYASFINALYYLLDGSSDNAKFEDDCRAIIGNQSYVLFTLDKLIYKLVKQLQAIATDEMDNKLIQLHEYEKSRKPGKFVDSVYHENACVLLHEENIYRFDFSSSPVRLSIQLMDNGYKKPEMVAVSVEPSFASYLYSEFLEVPTSRKILQGIMLQRNKRKYEGVDDEPSEMSKAMEGVQIFNGLECKIACKSSKISYVLDTEDFFFRAKRKRISCPENKRVRLEQSRTKRYHKFMSVVCR